MSNCQIIKSIKENKILAVVRTKSSKRAMDIANALIDGGIKVIEITMTCDNAISIIEELSKNKDIFVAAGSVITADSANKAIDAGAKLIVSPVTEFSLLKTCKARGIPIAAGSATPNEAYVAWKKGFDIIKIFPAHALGGPHYIKDILAPMPFLKLMPTGGIDVENFVDYIESGADYVGIGSCFYKDEENLDIIREKAKIAVKKLEDYKKKQG